MQHHPDKNPDDPLAHETFQKIGQAYETLSNANDRATYDQFGSTGPPRGGPSRAPDFDDIFASMFGDGHPFFTGDSDDEDEYGFNFSFNPAGPSRKPKRGKDTIVAYEITLEEAFQGKRVVMNLVRDRICKICGGSGGRHGAKEVGCGKCGGKGSIITDRHLGPGLIGKMKVPCDECDGHGTRIPERARCKKCHGKKVTKEKKRIDFMIDPGTEDGERIALKGEADEEPEVPPGDVIFHIRIKPHSLLRPLDHGNLGITLPLRLSEALLGFSRVMFTHLDGRGIRIESKRGERVIRHGEELIVKGEGMPIRGTTRKGDLRIRWEVEMPSTSWALGTDPNEKGIVLPAPLEDINPLPEKIVPCYLSPLR